MLVWYRCLLIYFDPRIGPSTHEKKTERKENETYLAGSFVSEVS